MSMTLTEKNRWEELIKKRIERRQADLWATDPLAKAKLEERADKAAWKYMGVDGHKKQRDKIKAQRATLKVADERLLAEMQKIVDPDEARYWNAEHVITAAVAERAVFELKQLMAKDKLGKQVADLDQELDNLTEIVLLATGPDTIKTFFEAVSEKLDTPLTDLEVAACVIAK